MLIFPMQTVTTVLSECGNNIDAAIKRLTGLRLSNEDPATGSQDPPEGESCIGWLRTTCLVDCTFLPARLLNPAGLTDQLSSASAVELQTGEQWVDCLVQEMSAAKDMQDARVRAASILQHFERFVKCSSKYEVCQFWHRPCVHNK